MNIKLKLKIHKLKKQMRNIWYSLMKPLAVIEMKIYNYIYNRKEKKIKLIASKLSDEDVVKLVMKDIIKYLVNHPPSWGIEFTYKVEYDNDILSYIGNSKNKILGQWTYQLKYTEREKKNDILLSLLKQELLNYPEIKCYEYQKNKYSDKILEIELKEDEK